MLTVAKDLLEAEAALKAEERDKFLQDNCPPLDLPYSREELTVSTTTKFPTNTATHNTHRVLLPPLDPGPRKTESYCPPWTLDLGRHSTHRVQLPPLDPGPRKT